jgi:hypothetical protein
VAWPLVGQIAAAVGLTVLEQAGMAIWDQLKSLGLVEYGDQRVACSAFPRDVQFQEVLSVC